ncbi:hypothetical protein BVI2075_70106 [Burkholderia vietnamiensis]|jgi:hypothetical protein|nr:hypothetical protein BVI2075_70106 [Burkholderia vietnamiensis]CAG9222339.1 hypothetical protein BVI1335_400068 [Burkholderia vietnamiensis]
MDNSDVRRYGQRCNPSRFGGQLLNENLANIAAQDPRLAAAVNGSGTNNINDSIGIGTTAEANRLGKIWVGDEATMMSDGSYVVVNKEWRGGAGL